MLKPNIKIRKQTKKNFNRAKYSAATGKYIKKELNYSKEIKKKIYIGTFRAYTKPRAC